MRKFVSALTIAAGLTLVAVPAYAQDDDYPPATSEGLTVSESTVTPGESIVVAGGGAEPGATVVITLTGPLSSTLGSGNRVVAAGPTLARLVAATRPLAQGSTVTLGSTTADGDGNFRITVTIPLDTEPGLYTLTATSGGEVLSAATIRVLAATTGGLAFTGSNVGPGLAVGAGLIVAGGLLLLAVRRRRRSTA
jgi:LPXTG cell wall anchor motif